MERLGAQTSDFLGSQHSSCLYSVALFPYLGVNKQFCTFLDCGPQSGRVITTKADARRANAETLRQPDTSFSKHIIIKQRCVWEEISDQKDTPKVTTLCSNFNTSYDPAAVPLWLQLIISPNPGSHYDSPGSKVACIVIRFLLWRFNFGNISNCHCM